MNREARSKETKQIVEQSQIEGEKNDEVFILFVVAFLSSCN